MANDITTVVWRIDTLPFSFTGRVYIANATWSDQVNVGDELTVTDQNSKPLFESKAQQANFLQNLGSPGWVNGIIVTKLDSGVLYLYVGGKR